MFSIRPATEHDLPGILEIYNDAIINTTATFDLDEKSQEEMMLWYRRHKEFHPVIVAIKADQIVGWASLSGWSDKKAYDTTAEVSLYVHKDFRKQGIGKKLLEIVTLEGKQAGLICLISRITEGNEVSLNLHEANGYSHIGVIQSAGKKFGRLLDVHLMQKVFS